MKQYIQSLSSIVADLDVISINLFYQGTRI